MHWRDELELAIQRCGMSYAEIGRQAGLKRTTVLRVRKSHVPGMHVLFAICSVIHSGAEFSEMYAHYSSQIIKEKLSKKPKT
jgi:hypothetical protein